MSRSFCVIFLIYCSQTQSNHPREKQQIRIKKVDNSLHRGYGACSPYTRQASSASPSVLGFGCGRSHLAEHFWDYPWSRQAMRPSCCQCLPAIARVCYTLWHGLAWKTKGTSLKKGHRFQPSTCAGHFSVYMFATKPYTLYCKILGPVNFDIANTAPAHFEETGL